MNLGCDILENAASQTLSSILHRTRQKEALGANLNLSSVPNVPAGATGGCAVIIQWDEFLELEGRLLLLVVGSVLLLGLRPLFIDFFPSQSWQDTQ